MHDATQHPNWRPLAEIIADQRRRRDHAWAFILASASASLPNGTTHAEALRLLRSKREGKLRAFCGYSRTNISERFKVTAATTRTLCAVLEVLLQIGKRNGSPLQETFERFTDYKLADKRTQAFRKDLAGHAWFRKTQAVGPEPLEEAPGHRKPARRSAGK